MLDFPGEIVEEDIPRVAEAFKNQIRTLSQDEPIAHYEKQDAQK